MCPYLQSEKASKTLKCATVIKIQSEKASKTSEHACCEKRARAGRQGFTYETKGDADARQISGTMNEARPQAYTALVGI